MISLSLLVVFGLTSLLNCETVELNDITFLVKEIENLKTVIGDQSKRIEELLIRQAKDTVRITDLEDVLEQKSRRLDELEKRCDAIDDRTNDEDNNRSTHQVDTELDRSEPSIAANIRRYLLGTDTPTDEKVAFSASLSVAPTQLGYEHSIPFDKALTNVGSSFDIVTHTFFCPLNGVYFFHMTLMSMYHDHIETELVKDNVVLARIYAAGAASTGSGHGYDQGTNAVVTSCNTGEHVWVRVRGHYGTALAGEEFSTFSGFLLFVL